MFLLPDTSALYNEQIRWAHQLLKSNEVEMSFAMRKANYTDMWSARNRVVPSNPCTTAYHLTSVEKYRKPVEILLLSGWSDLDISEAITHSRSHEMKISEDVIAKYRKYFFNPGILTSSTVKLLCLHYPWLRAALIGLDPDVLEYVAGLRYREYGSIEDRAYDAAWKKFIVTLESVPVRTDREGIKAFSALLSSSKILDRKDSSSQDDVPLIELFKSSSPELEEAPWTKT